MNEVDPKKIYDIFCDYYGEDKVDLVESPPLFYHIIIWFPEVEITNEYDESATIQDLFVKIVFDKFGTLSGTFNMIRSTYTDSQYYSQYCHSHVPRLESLDNTKVWKQPCLGDGPIRETILSLTRVFNEELYGLLCLELDKYVHTESLAGGPYIKISHIGEPLNRSISISNNSSIAYDLDVYITPAIRKIVNPFIKHLIYTDGIKFVFNGSQWVFNQSLHNLIINLSNKFIDYFNNRKLEGKLPDISVNKLEEQRILQRAEVDSTSIKYYYLDSRMKLPEVDDEIDILKFKGEWKKLKIIQANETEEESFNYFLTINVVQYIMNKLLTYLNYNYIDETTARSSYNSSTASKKTIYL